MKKLDERVYDLINESHSLVYQPGAPFNFLESILDSTSLRDHFLKNELSNGVIARIFERVLISDTTIPLSYDNCAGNLRKAKYILVGEKPSKPSTLHRTYPFLSTAGSSGWLNEQLERAEISELELFFINAYDSQDQPNNPNIIREIISAEKVIALGEEAYDWCQANKIEAIKTFHPQYWKRFKSKEKFPLIELLGG